MPRYRLSIEYDGRPFPADLFVVAERIGMEFVVVNIAQDNPETFIFGVEDDDTEMVPVGRFEEYVDNLLRDAPWH